MENVYQTKLEALSDKFLAATSEEERAKIGIEIKAIGELNALLNAATSPARKNSSGKVKIAKTGRKEYDESDLVLSVMETPLTFDYSPFVEGAAPQDRKTHRVEAIFCGFLKTGNQSETTLAIRACEDVADLKSGSLYGFRAASLKNPAQVVDRIA